MAVNKIFLEGFMGCGKSTFGKKLAEALEWKFVDLDDYIENKEGKTIPEIFETEGELYFRELETEAIQDTSSWKKTIVSCGGGTPCFNNNAESINEIGFSVYIKLSPEVLMERLLGEKAKRPLIAKLTDDELLSFIEAKLKERGVFYAKANKIFEYTDSGEKSFIQELKHIVS